MHLLLYLDSRQAQVTMKRYKPPKAKTRLQERRRPVERMAGLRLLAGLAGLSTAVGFCSGGLRPLRPRAGHLHLSMQMRPEDRCAAAARRPRDGALTAMGMTMTRSKRPGGGDVHGTKGRMPEFQDEVGIVAVGALTGFVTGMLVLLFKVGIGNMRDFTYEGPWGAVLDAVESTMQRAGLPLGMSLLNEMPPIMNVETLTSIPPSLNVELAFYPLLGGLLTSLLLVFLRATTGSSFGAPLSGQLEELQRGVTPNLPQFVARETAAVASLGSGCSLGPEGPSVEIGVTVSRVATQLLGKQLSIDLGEAKVLAAAGAAAGVSAGFNAPLTGVVFALEILLPSLNAAEVANVERDLVREDETRKNTKSAAAEDDVAVAVGTLPGLESSAGTARAAVSRATAGAVLTSAAIACLVIRSGFADVTSERFVVADYALVNTFTELPAYMALGILTGGVAATFRWLSAESKAFYAGAIKGAEFMGSVPEVLRPMLGAGLCGAVATKYPSVLFFGYDIVNSLLKETYPYIDDTGRLLTLLTLKMALTASCAGSGLMGGVFAPSLFFGATLGAAYDNLLHDVLGLDIGSTSSYATVGAAAVLAAVFRAPVTGILLLFELTRNYDIVLPLIATVATGTLAIDLIEIDSDSSVGPTWGWWWAPAPEREGERGRVIDSEEATPESGAATVPAAAAGTTLRGGAVFSQSAGSAETAETARSGAAADPAAGPEGPGLAELGGATSERQSPAAEVAAARGRGVPSSGDGAGTRTGGTDADG